MKKPVLAFGYALHGSFALTAMLSLVGIVAVVWLGSAHARLRFDRSNLDVTPALARQQGRDEIRIELTSNGFAPNEVQHTTGTFAIGVENNTLPGEYKLQLKAEDGTLVNELHVQKGSSAWTVTLQTGTYTLTEASHPQWICKIVIH